MENIRSAENIIFFYLVDGNCYLLVFGRQKVLTSFIRSTENIYFISPIENIIVLSSAHRNYCLILFDPAENYLVLFHLANRWKVLLAARLYEQNYSMHRSHLFANFRSPIISTTDRTCSDCTWRVRNSRIPSTAAVAISDRFCEMRENKTRLECIHPLRFHVLLSRGARWINASVFNSKAPRYWSAYHKSPSVIKPGLT